MSEIREGATYALVVLAVLAGILLGAVVASTAYAKAPCAPAGFGMTECAR